MKSRKNVYIAVALAIVVVIIFILLGFFGVKRAAAPQTTLSGPQQLLEELAATGGVSTLEKYPIAEGTGDGAKLGDQLLVHYTGELPDGTVFDSSRTRNQPFPLTLGVTSLIQGWTQGLVGAKKGERFLLAIPPSLGYGATGQGNIPPNATLIFDIEILDITPAALK